MWPAIGMTRPLCAVAVMTLLLPAVSADELPPDVWRDDASLRGVQFVDQTLGWAVGDHGAAWRTTDGGQTWEPRPIGEDVALNCVCFISADVGWAAGGTTVPFTGTASGSVFQTEDAGATWKRVNAGPLPRIHAIRFFNRLKGVAAGGASAACPSGVLVTDDGGMTWTPIQAATVTNPAGWRAASLIAMDRGVVVGPRERSASVGDGQLIASRATDPGLRSLNAVTLMDRLQGWAAGDGGMVLRTRDAGLVWEAPPSTLPSPARDLFDFQAIAAIGKNVWVAGRPGSFVWHSPDAGQTWRPQPTGSPLPILGLSFSSPTRGIAVGAMGQILRTTDGGTNWQAIRGTDRRAALLAIALRPDELSLPLAATLAGDQGYRSVALFPVRQDLTAADAETPGLDLRIQDAFAAVGGNAAVSDWPLPLTIPGIDRDRPALISEWNRRTENQLERVLVGRLVAAIRMWRPGIVVLDEPTTSDEAGQLLFQATQLAIRQAADSTQYAQQSPALAPWRVKKTYVRSRTVEKPDATIDVNGTLSRLGRTTVDLAGPAAARLGFGMHSVGAREAYRLLTPDEGPRPAGPFFGGLALQPGSPARRDVGEPLDDSQIAMLANRQRMLQAYADKAFDDPRQAAGVLAQIDELSAGLDDARAARQLSMLIESHRRNARWDLAEQTALQLIERYPEEPPAREAMTWLLRLWTGSEPVWRRMKDQGTRTTRAAGSVETLARRIDNAFTMAAAGKPAQTADELAELGPDPLTIVERDGALKIGATRRWDQATVGHWQSQALKIGSLIRQVDPALFASPEVQFPLAVAVRAGGGSAVAYMQRFAGGANGGWSPAAAAELTLARTGGTGEVPVAVSRRAVQPPHLDGRFTDLCWQAAKANNLASSAATSLPEGGMVFLAHDDTFLYFAASIPRAPGRPAPAIERAGRTHDAELTGHDRLVISLDLDRDYATYYQFAVDERGQTSERCWNDVSWNPSWFVAAEGDDERWRIEAAIPLEELSPRPPQIGELWAVSIARIVPAVGVQGWPQACDGKPRPESFGLLRFE